MKLAVRIVRNGLGGYTAVCTSLPGCYTRGSTVEEAREKLDEAIRGYLASLNNFVPESLVQDRAEYVEA